VLSDLYSIVSSSAAADACSSSTLDGYSYLSDLAALWASDVCCYFSADSSD